MGKQIYPEFTHPLETQKRKTLEKASVFKGLDGS